MEQRTRVAVIFGGRSAEHEVSLQSAKNIIEAIDKNRYEVVPIGIDKQGGWRVGQESHYLLHADNPKLIALNHSGESVALVPSPVEKNLVPLEGGLPLEPVDVVFPVLHGPYGEDGTIQGLLKLAGIPFVGAGVLGSALGMDKDVMKRLFRDAGLPVSKFVVLRRNATPDVAAILREVGLPCFVKPANMGSSVGVSKVESADQLPEAIRAAFIYDHKVVVEEYIAGRELECSVLGNDAPIASVPGEIVPHADFYSYEAKYIDENGAELIIPANVPADIVQQIQKLSIAAFQTLECEGMARVDMFLRGSNELVLNEINTIPGFTRISMYPKLWEASGLSYPELINRLIQLALERHQRDQALKTTYEA
ncbi:MAG: D-alanine--D-alanine ligase [Candidatus Hydrogenedentes bacterium]|nr:D-alanine--D-alanine ligase [Candidatus Hydrogenedentota bacterium]